MASWKARNLHLPVVVLLLLLTVYNAGATVTESVGLEDDEDNFYVGRLYIAFQLNVTCNGNWYNGNNILLLFSRVQNGIADGIRTDCAECPFENENLQQIRVSCYERKLVFQAIIEDWVSSNYPVPTILRQIEVRYNGSSGENMLIMADDFVSAEDLTGDLLLVPTNVSVQYSTMSSGSGEGPTTDEQVAISTELEQTDTTNEVEIAATDLSNFNTTVKGTDRTDLGVSGSLSCSPTSGTIFLLVLSALLSGTLVQLQQ